MIGCPVFTPYTETNEVNYTLIPKQFEIIKQLKFDCVLIGGTTGEWSLLTLFERIKLIIEWSNVTKNSEIKLLVHVSDPCIQNVHTLIDICRENNVWSVLLLPQQISKVYDVIDYLKAASDNFPFIYYHYPELYGYDNVDIKHMLANIPNMIGAKIVNTDIDNTLPTKNIFVSSMYYCSNSWECTFVEEFSKQNLKNKDFVNKIELLLKDNKKLKARYLIEYLYNLNLGTPRQSFEHCVNKTMFLKEAQKVL